MHRREGTVPGGGRLRRVAACALARPEKGASPGGGARAQENAPAGRSGRRFALSKVQSADQRMRLRMRCRLSPTADVPSHTPRAAMCQIASSVLRIGLFGQPCFPKTLNIQLCV